MNLLKSIRRRYLVALTLIATLVTLFTILVQYSIKAQSADAQLINTAGKQRMLSQKIALHYHQISAEKNATTLQKLKTELQSISHLFMENHLQLVNAKERPLSTELKAIYFQHPTENLDRRVKKYSEAAVLFTQNVELTESQHALFQRAFTNTLLTDLNSAVQQFESEALYRISLVGRLELALWALTILMLIFEVFAIFKPMESVIRRNMEKLVQKQNEAKSLQKKAESANEAKNAFLTTMSHELRTPLNGIIGMINLLHDSQLNHDQSVKLGIANSSAESLLKLIDEILDVCQFETGQTIIENIEFDLNELVNEVADGFKFEATSKKIDLVVHTQSLSNKQFLCPPRQIRQVLHHLISNAVKFTEQGEITVEAHTKPDHTVIFSVSDTGIGIEKDQLNTVFESFSQQDSGNARKYEGAGLGLSICKQLVELMNGKISIESEINKGSTFTIELPLQAVSSQPTNEVESDLLGEQFSEKTALIVEDNSINQLVLESILQQFGMHYQSVEDGEKAINLLQQNDAPFDVILMDCRMPNVDGYTATKAIRKGDAGIQHKESTIIAVTANALQGDKEKCLACGMNNYVTKPVDKEHLQRVLNMYLEHNPSTNTKISKRSK